jgi:hypothetical protein
LSKRIRKGDNAWSNWSPCSDFATDVWNRFSDEKLQDRHFFGLGYSDPNVLAESIRKRWRERAKNSN